MKMKIRPGDSDYFDSGSESQPLMSSDNSVNNSYNATHHYVFPNPDSETSDFDHPRPNGVDIVPIAPRFNRRPSFYSRRTTGPDATVVNGLRGHGDDEFLDRLNYFNKIKSSLTTMKSPPINNLLPISSYGSYSIEKLMEPVEEKKKQNSLITIFSIWNTTMGTSLLTMAWGIEKTGLFPGILIMLIISGICLFTANLLIKVSYNHGQPGENLEVPDLCRLLLGRWAEALAKLFSVVVLLGACIVYWILMSNFLYNSVLFIYEYFMDIKESGNETVLCHKLDNLTDAPTINTSIPVKLTDFEKYWELYSTVPIFLALIMFPLLNFKSATFFSKFNSLGTVSIMYLLLFVAVKAAGFGINLPDIRKEFEIKSNFTALSGMLSLSYFIHNIIISIMRNNKNPKNNERDLSIAYGLITLTYIFVGALFYVAFPLDKSCIEDNIFNNFPRSDIMNVIARFLLLFQLVTIFPLLAYMFRMEFFRNVKMVFEDVDLINDFSYFKTIILNVVFVFICIMFACFLPRIGTLVRYTGALSGMVYIFTLPVLLKIASLKKQGRFTPLKATFLLIITVAGALNLLAQFFISEK